MYVGCLIFFLLLILYLAFTFFFLLKEPGGEDHAPPSYWGACNPQRAPSEVHSNRFDRDKDLQGAPTDTLQEMNLLDES